MSIHRGGSTRARRLAGVAGGVVCAAAGPAAAQAVGGGGATVGAAGAAVPLVRLVLGFAVVLAVLIGASLVLRRVQRRRRALGGRAMRVVEVLPLGPRSRLVAVSLGGRVIVVGAGDSSVNRVAELTREEFDSLLGDARAPVIPFRERLRKLAGK